MKEPANYLRIISWCSSLEALMMIVNCCPTNGNTTLLLCLNYSNGSFGEFAWCEWICLVRVNLPGVLFEVSVTLKIMVYREFSVFRRTRMISDSQNSRLGYCITDHYILDDFSLYIWLHKIPPEKERVVICSNRTRTAFALASSDLDRRCPLADQVYTVEYVEGQRKLWPEYVNAQADWDQCLH